MTLKLMLTLILMLGTISPLYSTTDLNTAEITQTESQVAAPLPRVTQFWQDLQNSRWFTLGSTQAPPVYLIMDTSCGYCLKLLEQLSLPLQQQQLHVRIVLVGLLSEDSYLAAATILESPQPATTFMAFKNNPQSIKTRTSVSPQFDKIDINNALLIKWQLNVTPLMVFKTKENQTKVMEGLPQDMTAFLASLST